MQQVLGGVAWGVNRPYRDDLQLHGVPVEAADEVFGAAVDDVGVARIGDHEAALAAERVIPVALHDGALIIHAGDRDARVLLLGAVHVIGEAIVDRHVIELRGGLIGLRGSGVAAVERDCAGGVDAPRVGARDRDMDAPEYARGQAVTRQVGPARAAVDRAVQAAPRTAAREVPWQPSCLPERGVHDARVVRIEADIDRAGLLVLVEDLAPGLAAVGGAEHPALGVGAEGMAEGRDQNDSGIRRVDDQRADLAGVPEADVAPRRAPPQPARPQPRCRSPPWPAGPRRPAQRNAIACLLLGAPGSRVL